MNYLKRFEAAVSTLLGGCDMADEFFAFHPEMVEARRASAAYHRAKGGRYWKGALIFFRRTVQPVIRADRKAACKTRIGNIDEVR